MPPLPSQHRGPLIVAVVLIAALTVNWIAAVARFQVNVIAWDQWDFFTPLFSERGWLETFFWQHGPHRQGIGFLVTRVVMAFTAWDARAQSLLGVAVLVVAMLVALAVWRELTGRLRWRDLWLPLAGLSLVAYETVIMVPNVSHSVMPWLLILLTAWAWLRMEGLGRAVSVGGLAVLLLFTGFGLFAGASALGLLLVDVRLAEKPHRAAAWRTLACSGGIIAAGVWAFAHGYRFDPASAGFSFPHWPLSDYARFAALMLAMRGGFEDENGGAYFAGGVVLALILLALIWSVGQLGRGRAGRQLAVAAWLLGATLAFVIFTAVGRVHLGVTGGMSSRYLVLLLGAWLGLAGVAHVAAADGGVRRWLPAGVAVLGWAMALGPWLAAPVRPWAEWPGLAGLPAQSERDLTGNAERKTQWLAVLTDTGEWREAERRVPQALHPTAEAIGFEHRLAWLEERELAMYATPLAQRDWLPWCGRDGVRWIEVAGPAGDRWVGATATLWLRASADGFFNLRLSRSMLDTDADLPAQVTVEWGGKTHTLPWTQLRDGVSLAASMGWHTVRLRSPAGTVAIDPPRDNRQAAFFVETATLTPTPGFARWTLTDQGLVPVRSWRIASGFWGWEGDGEARFGWAGARLELRMEAREKCYFNLEVSHRFAPVDQGPIEVEYDGRRVPLTLGGNGRWQFSWAVPPDGREHVLVVHNPAGARSPAAMGEGDDARELALAVRRLDLTSEPAF